MPSNSHSEERELDIVKSEDDVSIKKEDDAPQSTKPAAKRRTKTGCLTCRKRRIKCDEEKPYCKNCIKSKRECAGYVQPLVYKQQQSFAGHDPGQQPSLSDFDFQRQDSYAPLHHPTHAEQGTFQPYGGFDSRVHPQAHQYGYPPSATSSYQYPDPSDFVAYHAPQYAIDNVGREPFHVQPPQPFQDSAQHVPTYPVEQSPDILYGAEHATHRHHAFNSVQDTHGTVSAFNAAGGMHISSVSGHPLHIYEQPPRQFTASDTVASSLRRPRIPRLVTPTGGASEVGYGHLDDPFDGDFDPEQDVDDSHHDRNQARASGQYLEQHIRDHRPGMLRSTKPTTPVSPIFDERNEKVFRHFVDVLGICMSTFERLPTNPLVPPQQHLWSYTMASAAFTNPALAHAILAVSSLHIAKIQQTSDSTALKHFTYAARRVGKVLSVSGKRHEAATLATVLLLGYYEILNADHSRWNLHLAGATKLVSEQDLTRMARRIRAARKRALQISMNSVASSNLPASDPFRHSIAPSLFDEAEWDVDENLVQEFTGTANLRYDEPDSNVLNTPDSHTVSEAEIVNHRTKIDLWWWFCKQDLFQSMVSGDRLLMPYEHNISCPPRGRINVADRAYATFDHLVLILSRLADFGGKDRHRKQRSIVAQGGQWLPPPWLSSQAGPPRQPGANAQSAGTGETGPQPKSSVPKQESKPGIQNRNPSANEGRVRQQRAAFASALPVGENIGLGMMPLSETPQMHSAFHSMGRAINEGGTHQEEMGPTKIREQLTLEEETATARLEHERITRVFDLFQRSLGPDFQALPNEGKDLSSPFGPALRYQSPEIACMWAHYFVGRALLQRLHPDMPPAAMVAAGITAGLTRAYTQAVGQICAGLFASLPPTAAGQPLSPRFAAAFMEISFAMLFCGIQYVDISQRGWIVAKLHNIAQMTGWSTSAAVAAACEIAWERMGQAGRGPPYTRTSFAPSLNSDIRVTGNLAPLMAQHATPISEVESEHESQFVNHDRSLISKHGPSRVHWAMGIMSVEEDVRQMNIGTE